jgi:hypothetical protein
MQAKNVLGHSEIAVKLSIGEAFRRIQLAPWQMVAGVSLVAGVGNGWAVLARQPVMPSPFLSALTMMVAVFAGWYAWAFFTHLVDIVLFGGHSNYADLRDAFAQAYVCQALSFFTFTHPLGFLWFWVAFYLTIMAWGVWGCDPTRPSWPQRWAC